MNHEDYDPDDRDAPRPEDVEDLNRDDDDDDDDASCPFCGRAVYIGAPKCPYCGQWFTADTPASRRSNGWLWPVAVALLIAVILVMWHGLGR